VASLATSGSKSHPYSDLHDLIHDDQTPDAMKAMMQGFLAQDILNDAWGDRAIRDTMAAAGAPDADDPEVRDGVSQEAKKREAPNREKAMEARERVEQAQANGEDPDPEDVALRDTYFDKEQGPGLMGNLRSLMTVLKDKFKQHVVSPATAVINHALSTGDTSALSSETLPHPDEGAAEPRPKDERDKARLTRRELFTGPGHRPAPSAEAPGGAPTGEGAPPSGEAPAKKPVKPLEKKHEATRDLTDDELDNEAGEYFENDFTQAALPGAFKDADDLKRRVKEAEVTHLDADQLADLANSDVGDVLRADDPAARAKELAEEYGRDLGRVERGIAEGAEMPPAVVLKDKNGKLVLMGGNTRLMGGAAAGASMPVKVIEVDSEFDEKAGEAAAAGGGGGGGGGEGGEARKPIEKFKEDLKGYRVGDDAPEFDGGSKEWVAEHEITTPGGSYVLGTPHVGESDDADKWIGESLVSSAVAAAEKAKKDGKKVVFLAEGGDAGADSWHREQGTEQGQVAEALDKLGDVEHGTWDDEAVGIDKQDGDKLSVDRDSEAVKQLSERYDAPGLVEGALAAAMWDQMDDEENPYTLSDEARKALESRGIDPDDKESLGKMWEDDELSSVAEAYARMRDENMARKIREIEEGGGVAIVTPGAQHAFQLKNTLSGGGKGSAAPEEGSEKEERKSGDVWQTSGGQWTGKNKAGDTDTFDSREKADAYAKGKKNEPFRVEPLPRPGKKTPEPSAGESKKPEKPKRQRRAVKDEHFDRTQDAVEALGSPIESSLTKLADDPDFIKMSPEQRYTRLGETLKQVMPGARAPGPGSQAPINITVPEEHAAPGVTSRQKIRLQPDSRGGEASGKGGHLGLGVKDILEAKTPEEVKTATKRMMGTMLHEMTHIYGYHGTDPAEFKDEDKKVRHIRYMTDPGEMRAHAKEFAWSYAQEHPDDQEVDFDKLADALKDVGKDWKVRQYFQQMNDEGVREKYDPEIQKLMQDAHDEMGDLVQHYADEYRKRGAKKGKMAADRVAEAWFAKHRTSRLADGWLAHVRSFHPDDPNRPIVVVRAA